MFRTVFFLVPLASIALASIALVSLVAHQLHDRTQLEGQVRRARVEAAQANAALIEANRQVTLQRSVIHQATQAARFAQAR